MANQLREAKVLSIKMLYEQGWSQRRIARELGINRESVARYLKQDSKPAKAPPGSPASKPATAEKASTGSAAENDNSKPATLSKAPTGSRSLCEPYREAILSWLEQGLSAQRMYQDLVIEHGFSGSYTVTSGDIVGGLPVGVQTSRVQDERFWPADNCFNFKEIWILLRVGWQFSPIWKRSITMSSQSSLPGNNSHQPIPSDNLFCRRAVESIG